MGKETIHSCIDKKNYHEAGFAPASEAPLGCCISRSTWIRSGGLNGSNVQDPACTLFLHTYTSRVHVPDVQAKRSCNSNRKMHSANAGEGAMSHASLQLIAF